MASRSRDGRRVNRAPAIWRGPLTPGDEGERPPIQHGVRAGRIFISWRVFSGLIVLALLTVLLVFFSADAFYVHSIQVGGLHYMTKEEVFALTGIANMHVFWIDPGTVREAILRSPTVADATVYVSWPPNMIQVIIEEREPALVWEQSGVATWIDLQGRVMRQRENRLDLLRVIADFTAEGPLGPDVAVSHDVVSGALQLHTLFSAVPALRYDPEKGLGYNDTRGWEAWFGTGTDMPEKVLIYNAIVANLQARGIIPGEISIADPDAPYYSVLSGR